MSQPIPQLPPDLAALFGQLLALGAPPRGGGQPLLQGGFPQLLAEEIEALTDADRAVLLASLEMLGEGVTPVDGGTGLPPDPASAATAWPASGVLPPVLARLASQLQHSGSAAQPGGEGLQHLMVTARGAVAVASGGGEGQAGGGPGDRPGPDLLALWAQQRQGGPTGALGAVTDGAFAEALDEVSPRQGGGDPWGALQARSGAGVPAASPPPAAARDLPGAFAWTLQAQVGSNAWKGEMAQRVAWLAGGEMQHAELRLNPPDLGPLKVSISVSRDEASIVFGSHHGAVRDAVEAALPRLREMLEASGLNLVQVDISHRDPDQAPAEGGDQGFPGGDGEAQGDGDTRAVDVTPAGRPRLGLVDAYV